MMMRKPVQDFFTFLLGGVLFAAGIFLFANQVMVGSGVRAMDIREELERLKSRIGRD